MSVGYTRQSAALQFVSWYPLFSKFKVLNTSHFFLLSQRRRNIESDAESVRYFELHTSTSPLLWTQCTLCCPGWDRTRLRDRYGHAAKKIPSHVKLLDIIAHKWRTRQTEDGLVAYANGMLSGTYVRTQTYNQKTLLPLSPSKAAASSLSSPILDPLTTYADIASCSFFSRPTDRAKYLSSRHNDGYYLRYQTYAFPGPTFRWSGHPTSLHDEKLQCRRSCGGLFTPTWMKGGDMFLLFSISIIIRCSRPR